tara:strand:+ start:1525 stop:2067 length:543 start_codon:yes stop_codon:yes gene_type:complete
MTQISDFSPEDFDLIISLPYRVGLHVSYADDEEGEQDDELEMRALQASIREMSGIHGDTPLVQEIATETLKHKDQWKKWEDGVFNIEPLCKKAIEAIEKTANKEEVKAYRAMLVEIATSVAQAYGEFGVEEEQDEGFFSGLMKKIAGGISDGGEANHPMNVSAAEDSAIERIKNALTISA